MKSYSRTLILVLYKSKRYPYAKGDSYTILSSVSLLLSCKSATVSTQCRGAIHRAHRLDCPFVGGNNIRAYVYFCKKVILRLISSVQESHADIINIMKGN